MKHTNRRWAGLALAAAVVAPFSGAHAQEERSYLLEEVVVTAQKREQNLQDVPVAVTALTGDQIQDSQIKDIRDLSTNVPTLVSSQSQTATTSSFSIRGIGTSGQNFGLEPSVGIYIDGVYRARQGSIINNLVDVESIEVLRGPQGALFGKNTLAGALNFRTVAPSHEQNAFVDVIAGDYGLLNVSGAFNASLVDDVLAMRVTGFSGQRDGYVDVVGFGEDVVNDRDRFGGRLQFLYTPTDALDARLIVDYSEIDEVCCAAVTRLNNFQGFGGVLGTDSLLAAPEAAGGLGVPVITAAQFEDNIMALNDLPTSTNEESGVSLEVNYDFENVTLTSITALRNFDTRDIIDGDFSAADILTRDNLAEQSAFTQELRFSGEFGEGNNYLFGAYYFTQEIDLVADTITLADSAQVFNLTSTDPTNPNAPSLQEVVDIIDSFAAAPIPGNPYQVTAPSFPDGGSAVNFMDQDHESIALFGQFDFELSDQWMLTVGARYTDERKELVSRFENAANSPAAPPPDLGAIGLTLAQIQGGQLNPGNPADVPTILGAFSPLYQPGWGFYLLDVLAPQPDRFDELEDDQTTGTVKLSYFPTDEIMFYASYSTGFKSGGTNTDRIAPEFDQVFQAETSQAAEIGMKAEFPEQNLRLNVAIHDTQVDDLQTSAFTGVGFNLQNAGNASTQGVEIEAFWRPTDTMDVQLSYAYNQAEFEDFENGVCWVAWPFQTGEADPGQATLGAPVCDRSGGLIPSNPENVLFLAIDKDFQLSNSLNLFTRLEYNYIDETMTDGNNDPFKLRDAFNFVNFRIGLDLDRWDSQVALWVRNATDENFYETQFDVPIQDGKQNAYPLEPRTWGINFRKTFD